MDGSHSTLDHVTLLGHWGSALHTLYCVYILCTRRSQAHKFKVVSPLLPSGVQLAA
jgi:hypothetical protein